VVWSGWSSVGHKVLMDAEYQAATNEIELVTVCRPKRQFRNA